LVEITSLLSCSFRFWSAGLFRRNWVMEGVSQSVQMSQEKSLMFIRTEAFSEESRSELHPPADISSSRIYCALYKPKCEINPFMSHVSMVRWASALTDSVQSPVYLQADWFSVAAQGLDEQLTLSNIMRALSASKEPQVILSVSSKSPVVCSRPGEVVLLDCGFWVDPSSLLHGSGFSVELFLAHDRKNDRFTETSETRANIDITSLYETGNASLILEEAQVRHTDTYICTVCLPHLLPQGAPSLLPLLVPGQVLLVQCEASGFAPHTLDLSWEFRGQTGRPALWSGQCNGSQTAGLGRDGDVTCVAEHEGGTRRAAAALNDSMVMVAVALVLYGMIKFLSWTFSSSGESVQSDHYNLKFFSSITALEIFIL
uniref:Ig-like domain-containing protein n=1 Tax=Cyprinus carpio TaxID=7962 RepID=A0A8C1S4F8_CYPCA